MFSVIIGYLLSNIYSRTLVTANGPVIFIAYAFMLEITISGIRNMLLPDVFIIIVCLVLLMLHKNSKRYAAY